MSSGFLSSNAQFHLKDVELGLQLGAHTLLNCCKLLPSIAPREGSCLTLRNEVSEETCADQARDLIGKERRVQSRREREPGRTAVLRG